MCPSPKCRNSPRCSRRDLHGKHARKRDSAETPDLMPFHVVPATGAVLEQVLDDTFPLWNDGLSRDGYAKAWTAQLKTAWGQGHLDRVALVDGPHVMCSAKRYDLSLRLDGR